MCTEAAKDHRKVFLLPYANPLCYEALWPVISFHATRFYASLEIEGFFNSRLLVFNILTVAFNCLPTKLCFKLLRHTVLLLSTFLPIERVLTIFSDNKDRRKTEKKSRRENFQPAFSWVEKFSKLYISESRNFLSVFLAVHGIPFVLEICSKYLVYLISKMKLGLHRTIFLIVWRSIVLSIHLHVAYFICMFPPDSQTHAHVWLSFLRTFLSQLQFYWFYYIFFPSSFPSLAWAAGWRLAAPWTNSGAGCGRRAPTRKNNTGFFKNKYREMCVIAE